MTNGICIPMLVIKPIENITYTSVEKYAIGDIFQYSINDVIHIALRESGFFKPIDNKDCKFICGYVGLEMPDKTYDMGEEVNVAHISDDAIENLILIGYLIKEYVGTKSDINSDININKITPKEIKPKVKSKSKSKSKDKTYASLAKEMGIALGKFKKLYSEKFQKEIKDVKKNISKSKEKQIIEALS